MKTIQEILKKYELLPAQDMLYKPRNPIKLKVLQNQKLVPNDYDEDVRHIVLSLKGTNYNYTEGQSLGIIPPGLDKNNKPYSVRLYSIASSRKENPDTVSLCVKRVVYKNETGETIKGICSNYICDLNEGDEVLATGPVGKHFSLPADNTVDLLFFATGTGIAPFRGFLYKIFYENYPYKGNIHLFFGTRYQKDHLYANSINQDLFQFANRENFKFFSALSRENPNKKIYVHHLLEENKEYIEDILGRNHFIVYICGLKGMEENIFSFFKKFYEKKLNYNFEADEWKQFTRELEKNHIFIIETY